MAKQTSGVNKVRVRARHAANKLSRSETEAHVRKLLSTGTAYFGSPEDKLTFEFMCARVGVEVDWVRHDLNVGEFFGDEGWSAPVEEEKEIGKKGPAKRESTGAQSGQRGWGEENDGWEGTADGGRYA